MSKQIVVVKDGPGCRVLVNPSIAQYENKEHLINPCTARVRGLSPEEWDILGGKLVSKHKAILPPPHAPVGLDQRMAKLESKIKAIPRLVTMAAPKAEIRSLSSEVSYKTKLVIGLISILGINAIITWIYVS